MRLLPKGVSVRRPDGFNRGTYMIDISRDGKWDSTWFIDGNSKERRARRWIRERYTNALSAKIFAEFRKNSIMAKIMDQSPSESTH